MSETSTSSSPIVTILVILVIVIVLGLAFYFFVYKNLNKPQDVASTVQTAPIDVRMTAEEVQKVINDFSIKDANGTPTLHYNGGFENPDLSRFSIPVMQRMLKDKWWFALINSSGPNTSNGYSIGTNGLYILSFLDRKNTSNPINSAKSAVTIPAQIAQYL